MYTIKVKYMERAEFSSVVTWLDNGQYLFGTPAAQLVTLAFMIYDEEIKTKMVLAKGDVEQVISTLLQGFKNDYLDVIEHLLKITTLEDVNEMLQIIETFIRTYLSKHQTLLLKP